jgi:large subunit ribosomal protein L9
MKIILKENIENLGKRGDIINVAAGYGRNYLIPRKLALQVTPSNMKMIEMEQKALRKKLEGEVKSFQSVIDQLNQTSLSFERKAGDKDVIFGSVSTSDIKEALDKLGIEVEKKKILLAEPIKRLGNFTVPIKVFHDEQPEIKIEVKKEGAEDEKKKPAVSEEKAEEKETVKAEDKKEESPVEPELEKKKEPVLEEAKEEVTAEKKQEESPIEPEPEKKDEPPAEETKEEVTEEEKPDQSETVPEIPEEKSEAVIETKPEELSEGSEDKKKD